MENYEIQIKNFKSDAHDTWINLFHELDILCEKQDRVIIIDSLLRIYFDQNFATQVKNKILEYSSYFTTCIFGIHLLVERFDTIINKYLIPFIKKSIKLECDNYIHIIDYCIHVNEHFKSPIICIKRLFNHDQKSITKDQKNILRSITENLTHNFDEVAALVLINNFNENHCFANVYTLQETILKNNADDLNNFIRNSIKYSADAVNIRNYMINLKEFLLKSNFFKLENEKYRKFLNKQIQIAFFNEYIDDEQNIVFTFFDYTLPQLLNQSSNINKFEYQSINICANNKEKYYLINLLDKFIELDNDTLMFICENSNCYIQYTFFACSKFKSELLPKYKIEKIYIYPRGKKRKYLKRYKQYALINQCIYLLKVEECIYDKDFKFFKTIDITNMIIFNGYNYI